jgi:hypothetical protein
MKKEQFTPAARSITSAFEGLAEARELIEEVERAARLQLGRRELPDTRPSRRSRKTSLAEHTDATSRDPGAC